MIKAMREGKTTTVAVGGLKQKTGTFGLAVVWGDDENQIKNRRIVDVSHTAHDSLRPEMHGAWAGLKLTDMLMKMRLSLQCFKFKITMHADNDEAIGRAKNKRKGHSATGRTRGEYDAEAEIRNLTGKHDFVEFDCVKGHQDEDKTREEMMHPEWINALADNWVAHCYFRNSS